MAFLKQTNSEPNPFVLNGISALYYFSNRYSSPREVSSQRERRRTLTAVENSFSSKTTKQRSENIDTQRCVLFNISVPFFLGDEETSPFLWQWATFHLVQCTFLYLGKRWGVSKWRYGEGAGGNCTKSKYTKEIVKYPTVNFNFSQCEALIPKLRAPLVCKLIWH